MPVAQDGSQSSIFSVPVPTASAGFHVGQVMFHSEVVPSPDSGHPAAQLEACIAVPFVSPPSAKYTVSSWAEGTLTGEAEFDAGTTDGWDTDAEIESDGLAALADDDAAAVAAPVAEAEPDPWQPAVAAISVAASAAAGRNARMRKVKASPALAESERRLKNCRNVPSAAARARPIRRT